MESMYQKGLIFEFHPYESLWVLTCTLLYPGDTSKDRGQRKIEPSGARRGLIVGKKMSSPRQGVSEMGIPCGGRGERGTTTIMGVECRAEWKPHGRRPPSWGAECPAKREKEKERKYQRKKEKEREKRLPEYLIA